jgi:ubiquinone/menaquinone biosynthesis C-methylase UbiE
MQQPERVFAEVYRVLRPGGVAIFTFSNRMFYGKVRRCLGSPSSSV